MLKRLASNGGTVRRVLKGQTMTIPPSDHVIWRLARLALLGVLFLAGASLAYNNGLSKADILPLLTLLAGVGGFDLIKDAVTHRNEH